MNPSVWFQKTINLKSRSQGCHLITNEIMEAIGPEIKKFDVGLCNLFLAHTSAGLALGENCDPTVRSDMHKFFNKMVPEGKGLYEHDDEGPDDMPAHIKSAITGVSINIPISQGSLGLGTWQGVYLMEYRASKHTRKLVVTINGSVKQ